MGLRSVIIILLNVFMLLKANAQLSINEVVDKYDSYQRTIPKTKLHLSLNQSKFIPGDTVYFSAYFLSEDLIGVEGRQLLDLHLIGSDGNSLVHFKYAVKDGFGYNQLALPKSLQPGIYHIVSYSSWMRNFKSNFIYKKEIEVVIQKKLTVNKMPKIGIEGGQLIAGVPNKIVVNGLGTGRTVALKEESEQLVASTEITGTGEATFVVTPANGAEYYITHGTDKLLLPKPVLDGYSLNLKSIGKGELQVRLYTSPRSKYINKDLFLILTARGRILYSASFNQGSSGITILNIPKSNIPDGVAHISLLDTGGKPLAERDFYNGSEPAVDLSIVLDKSTFEPREKVKVQFRLDSDKSSIKNVSIRVLNQALHQQSVNSLSDELNILTSIEDDFLINRSDSNWQETLDYNLIVNGAKENWDDILSDQAPKPAFAFTTVMRKSGIAYVNDSTNERVPADTKIVFYMQKSMWRYETSVLDNGEVWLMIPEQYGQDEIFYFAENYRGRRIEGLKIKWNSEEVDDFSQPTSASESKMHDKYGEFANNSAAVNRAFSFFTNADMALVEKVQNNANDAFEQRLYGADINVKVQDYQLFPTMDEMIREIVPSVIHRGKKDLGYVRVTLPQPMDLATDGPLYIINGIATKDTKYFLSLKPADVLTVKVVNSPQKLMPLGLLGKNGIIMIQTKTGEERPPVSADDIVDGQNRNMKFKNLDIQERGNLNHPYFRSTIYWNPDVSMNGSNEGIFEFYLSDDVGEVLILLEGITNMGEPFSASKFIKVNTVH
ncbi:hypothetical protein [Fulvivirga lutimaris]|uniref:hypothetical protein n=1 Tax=Fulvivirga lutimaris TaxID=1819566 RepID=UPI0012BBC1C9|nr:hypothetical protein [Fulvivirga lutimaris]MTI38815.1 hypothetical protein [Fulvivirga lutimaris]